MTSPASATRESLDLRKMTVAEVKSILREHGITDYRDMSRWEMVDLVRTLCKSEQPHSKSPSPKVSREGSPAPKLMEGVQEPPGDRISPSLSALRASARKSSRRRTSPEFFLSKTVIAIIAFIFAALVLAQFV